MTETYTTVKTAKSNDNEHFLRAHYPEVAEIMADLGHDNELMDMLKPPIHDSIPRDAAVSPDLSKPIRDMIQKSQLPFALEDDLAGCFGDARGSSNVTTIFEETGMAMREAFKILDMTGQLDDAKKLIDTKRADSDPSVNDILAYAMATFSKGWRAERFLTANDRWKTGSVSQDQGGMDLYDNELNCWVQLKPATVAASNGHKKYMNKDVKHLFYFWNNEGDLVVTEAENWKEPKSKESDKTGLPGTLLVNSANLKVNRETRPFRYLFW